MENNIKMYAFAADGTEEAELLTVVDLLKRAKIDVKIVTINDSLEFTSSHKTVIKADLKINDCDFSDGDILFIPGGMPGSSNLSNCHKLIKLIDKYNNENKLITAICAAPAVVLGKHGYLDGKKATCYPGFENLMSAAKYTTQGVVRDGNIITSKGLGFAIDLGLEIIKTVKSYDDAIAIAEQIQYKR